MINAPLFPTYVINLQERMDRAKHIRSEFSKKKCFDVTVVNAVKHEIGAIGLWESIRKVLLHAIKKDFDYFIICEDDHQFTEDYSDILLTECIDTAMQNEADILCGGPSWFEDAFPISENLFWVRKFSGTQFIVFFRRFYQSILSASFDNRFAVDHKISMLTSNKYFIYPFISIQKEFGYSDVTQMNSQAYRVDELFRTAKKKARIIKDIFLFYQNNKSSKEHRSIVFDSITIPTYVINLTRGKQREEQIASQFVEKKEFDIMIVDAIKHEIGSVGLWQSIRKIIQIAVNNGDDVIIICEDEHEFALNYSKEYLIKNVVEGYNQGCDYLNCGTSKFDVVVPVSANRFWTNCCLSTQFMVVYKRFFQKILEEPYDGTIAVDLKLSEMTSTKMILYPFISVRRGLGDSDITLVRNKEENLIANMISASESRLDVISKNIFRHSIF